jgi:hypothetical protein
MTLKLFLILTLILGLGCGDESTTPTDADGARWLVKSPDSGGDFPGGLEPNILPPSNYHRNEAADLATWWSGELYAPEALTYQIVTELRELRLKYSGLYPSAVIQFQPVNAPGQLIFGFTDEGWEMWKNGTYDAWDSLNTALAVDSIVELGVYAYIHKNVLIYFDGRPNVQRLIELYRALPELNYVSGNDFCCDWPILLMWREENVSHYFFRNAWGDCPSGCIYEDFHYFTVVEGEPIYIGYYLHDWDHPLPRPDWMNMADLAADKYWSY